MTDEELLKALTQQAGEERSDALEQDGWEAVAAGQADDTEREALVRQARAEGWTAEQLAAFEPLGPDAEERFARAVEAELAAEAPGQQQVPADRGQVISLAAARQRKMWITAAAGLGLAAAAALVLVVVGPRGGAPLPPYSLSHKGGEKIFRGDRQPGELVKLRPGSQLELLLRPPTPAVGPVKLVCFVVSQGAWRPWKVKTTISADGAVLVVAELGRTLKLTPGRHQLVLVLARPELLPEPGGHALHELRSDPAGGRVVLRLDVQYSLHAE